MADPISWLVLEPGHRVVTSDGEELGKVEQVLGDRTADIFDGLSVATAVLGKPTYVPAEAIESIDTEAVRLSISPENAAKLDELQPPRAVAEEL
jgi:hypothetical protein